MRSAGTRRAHLEPLLDTLSDADSGTGASMRSLGAITVTTPRGADIDSTTALRRERSTDPAEFKRITLRDIGRASPSISEVSGASNGRCHVAWSPMMLTTGEFARRALWRLASPLASPGPRCNRVSAGTPATRA